MSLPIPLRGDYDARMLGHLAKDSIDAAQTRRLLALASIYDGASRAKAAETVKSHPTVTPPETELISLIMLAFRIVQRGHGWTRNMIP